MNNQTLGLLLGITALVLMGLGNAISKTPAKYFSSTKMVFWRNLFTSSFLLIWLLISYKTINFSLEYTLITLVIAFLGYWPLYFFYRAMAIGKVGIVSPISSSYTLITALLSFVIFKEMLEPKQVIALALMIIGLILLTVNLKDFKNSDLFNKKSGITFAILAAIGWGVYFFLIKIPVTEMGPVYTSFIVEFTLFVMAGIFLLFNKKDNTKNTIKNVMPIALIGLFSTFGITAYYKGIEIYSLSVLTALVASTPLVVCLYGVLVYKERLSLKQYLSIGLLLVGMIVLSI